MELQFDIHNDPLLKEVNRLRLWFFYFPALCFVGFSVVFFLLLASGINPSGLISTLFQGAAFIGWLITASCIRDLKCPRCNNKAIKKVPAFSMDNVRCQWCDYPYKNSFENGEDVVGDQWKQPPDQAAQDEIDSLIGDQWRFPPK